ncbi:MAG: HAD-IIIC family phosphatase [Myxococcota bacterium]|nr:HAD-IIIC family phosphatase [Myxococcota bacterium]
MTSVAQILSTVDGKPASYLAAARQLAAAPPDHLTAVRVAVLASYTFDLVTPYLVVEGARRGLDVRTTLAPYGQLEQQVLDPASSLYAGDPTLIIVATRIEELAPALANGFVALTAGEIEDAIETYVARLEALAQMARARTGALLVICNQAPPRRVAAGLADAALETSQQFAIAALNRKLQRLGAIPGTSIFDLARVAAEVGIRDFYDLKLGFLARSPLAGKAQLEIGRRLARHARALHKPSCKCLVLDLDNTLWGGVLGEDGAGAIALGDDYPGSVFKAFQHALRSYRDRGVLLAIASKNNEADVVELFEQHRDMVLRLDDFAARQIHWSDKAASLRAIAEQLNIGLDALAFFDDNPVERAWVREQVPEVVVIDVPANPMQYLDALDDSGAFDQLVVTSEDRARAAQYQVESERRALAQSAGSVDEFLRALEMRVVIGSIDAATLPRVVQLLGKTNQFNVTTRRHSEATLTSLLAAGGVGLWMRVSDRYGDNGLVGVAIAVLDGPDRYRLDSLLISCRVLGRLAEHALLASIVRRIREAGATTLLGEFIPTKKNVPAAGFFASAGFAPITDRENWWTLDLGAAPPASSLFEVIEES